MAKLRRGLRCPDCNGRWLTIRETVIGSTDFDQDEQGRIEPRGWHSSGADPEFLHGICVACGYKWRIRNAKQIIDCPATPTIRRPRTTGKREG